MTPVGTSERFALARRVADAVLWEGYVLYPYRASAAKNQVRFQFGVLAPRAWSDAGGCEAWSNQTECLIEAEGEVRIIGQTRFLHVQQRIVEELYDLPNGRCRAVESLEREGQLWMSWEEAVEHTVDVDVVVPPQGGEWSVPFHVPYGRELEPIRAPSGALAGWFVRQHAALTGQVRITASRIAGALVRLRLEVENLTPWDVPHARREQAVRAAFVGVHSLLAAAGGTFLSLVDAPPWAAPAAAACANVRTWPVLVAEPGAADVVLSSPIILPDYPEIAAESPGDLFDATEIDEILTLRTMTLTDDEKQQARATDARAAAILDRVDTMPAEMLERLHGAIRSLRPAPSAPPPGPATEPLAPWWDPAADAAVDPATDAITIGSAAVAKGSRVRLRPGLRSADAQDMFLVGRVARVEGVFFDVDDRRYLAVTLEDDPAADLHQIHGRFLYFAPDEVEPLEGAA